jgi:hypothetical protein
METGDPQIPNDQAPESDEPHAQAYEPPSITELGAFVELTAGGAGVGFDADSASNAL